MQMPLSLRTISIVAASLVLAGGSLAQTARDDIDRNLQERRVREREFHVDLYDAPPIAPQSPALTRRSVFLPTPGAGLFERSQPLRAPLRPPDAVPRSSAAEDSLQLDESQRRRQLELQSQTLPLEESLRRPMLDAQQLQFEREQRARQLQSEIMRNSERALRAR
jgi:hypothetical protein